MTTYHGILNLYKPAGVTSHDMVSRVRGILREKRVGHAGTLDPAAVGVLPVCVGQATRVVEYLSDARKVYCAEIGLGLTTDTYDGEGVVTAVNDVPDFSLEEIERAADNLRGPIMQLPPIYSAIKVGGQPLYKAARAGTAANIEIQPRPVEIHRLTINAWVRPWLRIWVDCSKGTYIRSLAHDLGQLLGCGGFMHSLVRVQSGPFHLSRSVTLEELEAAVQAGRVEDDILQPLDTVLGEWPAWIVDDATATRLRQGRNLSSSHPGWRLNPETTHDYPFRRVYTAEGDLLALLEQDGNEWHPAKVFTFE